MGAGEVHCTVELGERSEEEGSRGRCGRKCGKEQKAWENDQERRISLAGLAALGDVAGESKDRPERLRCSESWPQPCSKVECGKSAGSVGSSG
ncbi:hypothetical protein MPNT_160012 [Candidatus Methylacidithermus pantelleriae]|uniref:Uncharacterized protein n=1 Tax=Candidatus Methylacidithermus pantelleriae TaxID=2744239 RepID=A0A8J2BKR8_9BACT|nr:hypothetical protein MPNT_160012 [Candidatus Methylacidithermus pantelleriae]